MSELRRDPVSDRWVVITAERANRPGAFLNEAPEPPPEFDPFAEGNEDKTPREIAAVREPNTPPNKPGWRIRVVPNKFPALRVEGQIDKHGVGVYDRMQGIGAHEIIIETPQCVRSFTGLPDRHVVEILGMYRDRLNDLAGDQRFLYGMLFKNVGAAAGATLYHTHSQLIAMPILPRALRVKMDRMKQYVQYRERCLLCDLVSQELDQQVRVVMDSGSFVAFSPYASRFPFEIWVFPKVHQSHFEALHPSLSEELAFLLKRVLLKIEKGLGTPAYSYMLFTSPFRTAHSDEFHWHIEITPRLTRVAGFEWGMGFYINPVPPEDAAAFLRNVKQ
jgi:UDPglucose--hexose-1-phosphate uridylyltransferase